MCHHNVLKWLQSYLNNRKQGVIINGVTSSWCNIKSGVPQGSIFGPLLFILYVNDLPVNIPDRSLLFADDANLFRHIKNSNDCLHLQKSIN